MRMHARARWKAQLFLLVVLLLGSEITSKDEEKGRAVPSTRVAAAGGDLKNIDQDLLKKLLQMEKTFAALQAEFKGMHGLHDKTAKLRTLVIERQFKRLMTIIKTLKGQKDTLYVHNKALKQENGQLVAKLQQLEKQLAVLSEQARNPDVAVWMRQKAKELAEHFRNSSLGLHSSAAVSPVVAGIVSYGVLLFPNALVVIHIVKYGRTISIFRSLMLLNVFELGFITATILSIALLLGDPLQGMQAISEVNFVFIQLVLALVFWVSVALILVKMYLTRVPSARRFLLAELLLRILVAADYGKRVWLPAVQRAGPIHQLPGFLYFAYFLASALSTKLTSKAQTLDSQGTDDVLHSLSDFRSSEKNAVVQSFLSHTD